MPERFQIMAKEAVVANFNKHRNPDKMPALTLDGVHVDWFSKTLGNWKAILTAPVASSLLWEVSYDGAAKMLVMEVYSQLNRVKIAQTAGS